MLLASVISKLFQWLLLGNIFFRKRKKISYISISNSNGRLWAFFFFLNRLYFLEQLYVHSKIEWKV